ncbi:hypothetical protein BDZ91DRAFT_169556 [Kalaharituber pfeilii]|nr:hypothetical protein BDZ91DRAFT_169556 [Kalaharituber pfeilii]
MSGRSRGSKKQPPKTQKLTPSANSSSTTRSSTEAHNEKGCSLAASLSSLKLSEVPCEDDTSSEKDASSGASSTTTPRASISAPAQRHAFLCYRTRHPKTLVNGVFRKHDPKSLPEPLKQGLIEWGFLQRRRPGEGPSKRLDDAETLYNNRTLRYWRMSTDYDRFIVDDGPPGTVNGEEDENAVFEEVNGVLMRAPERPAVSPTSQVYWSSPQRPYTAPPHQIVR